MSGLLPLAPVLYGEENAEVFEPRRRAENMSPKDVERVDRRRLSIPGRDVELVGATESPLLDSLDSAKFFTNL